MKKNILAAFFVFSLFSGVFAQNLLTNGNFEGGGNGTGFNVSGTGYNQINPPYSGNTAPGDFAFTTNPAPLNAVYIAGGDHTTGTGNMLVIDGNSSAAGQPLFWAAGNTPGSTICGLVSGNKYIFRYWIKSVSNTVTNAATQANINVTATNVSGLSLQTGSALAPLPAAGWQQVVYTFTATSSCIELGLWNSNTSLVGNDFAVDDLAVVALPTATISGSTTVCQNTPTSVTFTGANGVAPYTFNYLLNGASQSVTTVAGNSVTVPVPVGTANTYTYDLQSVSYGAAPVISQNQSGQAVVIVKPNPTGSISGTATVCQNSTGNYITFTGANGTAPYFFTYTINGGSTQLASSGSGNSAAVFVPSDTVGSFVYQLVGVSYSSSPPCSTATFTPSTATVDVISVPDGEISGTTNVCPNAPGVVVTFTGSGATSPYTFTYNINGGASQTVSTAVGSNSVTVPVNTATNGVFTYTLTQVSSGVTPTCDIPLNETAVVTVGQPTSVILGSTTILAGGSATLTFYGTPLATVNFTSPLGPASVVINAQGVGTYNIPYIAQTTTFSLVNATSGLPPFCVQPLSGSATITVNNNTCSLPLLEVSIDVPAQVCNVGECTDLLAHFSNVGSTSDYVVTPIPYCPSFPFTGGIVIPATGDDTWSPVVNLPFGFEFYGNCYNQVLVGTNGVITFDLAGQAPLGFCQWAYNQTIPNAGFPIKNAIYGVYQDTDIRAAVIAADAIPDAIQNVNYYVLNTGPNIAPNRVFVANFNELPQFQCGAASGVQTSQIVIHEGTNIIEVFVNKRTPCNSWNGGRGVIGVQNLAGTLATVPPGRNTGNWNTTSEAWRFIPKNQPPVPTTISWLEGGNPVGSLNQNPLNVCPTGPTTYTAVVTYPGCNGPSVVTKDITIDVAPPLPVLDPVDIEICSAALPYTFDLYQTDDMLAGVPNPGDYEIKYYDNLDGATYDLPTNLPVTTDASGNHVFYTTSGPFPLKIYVRVASLSGADCYNIRTFTINVGSPHGAILYNNSPFCNNVATAPVTEINLTTGGSYSAQVVPPGPETLALDPVTGTITPSASDPGIYLVTYSIPAAPPCPAFDTSTSVEIIACTCTVTANSTSEALCVNTALNAMVFTTVNASAGSISAGSLPPGVTGSYNAATGEFTVSGTPTTAGLYNFTVQMISPNGPCTLNATIDVGTAHTLAFDATGGAQSQTLCLGDAINAIVFTYGGGATGATVSGLPVEITALVDTTAQTITLSGTPATNSTINYTVTTTGAGCPVLTATGTIDFDPDDSLTLDAASDDAQVICENGAIAPIVYNFTGTAATTVTVTGLPASLTQNINNAAGTLTISGTTTGTLPINYSVTTTGCNPVTLSGSINFNPNDNLVLDSSATSDNQTICLGDPIDEIRYSFFGSMSATSVNITGLPATLVPVIDTSTQLVTINGTPATNAPINYTITTINGCNPVTLSGTINFNADDTLALAAGSNDNQTVCEGAAIGTITYNFTSIDPNVSVTGLPPEITATVGATTVTLAGTPLAASAPINYTLTTNGCNPQTLSGTIDIAPAHTLAHDAASGSENQVICLNDALVPIVYTFGGGATGANIAGLPAELTAAVSGNTVTISGTPATSAPINFTVITTDVLGCPSVTLTGSITFSPDDTLVLAAGSNDAQTICEGAAILPIVYNFTSVDPNITFTGLPPEITTTVTSNTITLNGTPSGNTVINYTIETNGCNAVQMMGSITINPADTLVHDTTSGGENQAICLGDAIVPIVYNFGGGATGISVSGLPSEMVAVITGNTVTISGTPATNATINFTLTTSNALGCPPVLLSGSITINPDDTLAYQAGSGPQNPTLCEGDALVPIVFDYNSNDPNITITGLPSEIVALIDTSLNTITLSGTPATFGTINYTIATNGCNPKMETGTITVNPNDTLVLDSGSDDAQTICLGDAIAPINYTFGGGATGVTVTGLPAPLTAVTTGNSVVISGTPASNAPISYTLTTTNTTGCPTVLVTGTINFNPDDTLAYQTGSGPQSPTLCEGDALVPIVFDYSSTDPNITISGLPSEIVALIDTTLNTITLSGTPATFGTINYTIATNGCNPKTETGIITVNPGDTLVLDAGSDDAQTICLGDAMVPINYTFGGGATGVVVTGLPAPLTAVTTGNSVVISGTPGSSTPISYTVTTTNGTGCPAQVMSGNILFSPDDTLSLQPGSGARNQTVCAGVAINPIIFDFTSVNPNVTVSGLPPELTAAVGANTITISGTPTTSGTINYTIATNGCNATGDSGTITVNPQDTLSHDTTSGSTAQNICLADAIVPIVYIFGGGANGVSVTGLPAEMSTVVSGNTLTISGTPASNTTINYTVTTTNTTGCPPVVLTGAITFKQPSTLTLASGSANATLCINEAYTVNPIRYTFGGSANAVVFANLPPGITASTAGNTATLSGLPTVAGTYNYTVTTQNGCLPNASAGGTIIINPAVTLAVSSATQTVCIGTPVSAVVFTFGSGATSASITGGALPAGLTATSGANTLTISGTPTAAGNFNIDVTTAGGCSSVTKTTQFIVTGPSTLVLQSAPGTTTPSVCFNQPITNIVYTPGGSATQAAVTTPLPAGVSAQMIGGQLVISGTPTVAGTYPYTVSTTNGCTTPTLSGTITVRGPATIGLVTPNTGSPAACIGQENVNIEYVVGNGATGATASGLPPGVSSSFDATTNVLLISGIPTQAGSFPYTVSVVGGCPANPVTGTITVDPLPVAVLPQGLSICVDEFGTPIAQVELTTGLPLANYTFEWSDSAGVIAGATSNSYFATAPGTYSVVVTNNLTGCYDSAQTIVNTSLPPQQVIANVSSYFADTTSITVQVLPVGTYLYQLDGGAWQSSNQFLNVGSGYHDVNVKDIGGCDNKMVQVRIIDYPRFFTPNGDGYNETWNIPDLEDQLGAKIEIYDRYGKLIKEISPLGSGWDGSMNGQPLPSTDYWFKVYFTEQGAARIFRSHFSLKR